MVRIPGLLGACIRDSRRVLVLEVTAAEWDWQTYVRHAREMQLRYETFISERHGGRKGTVGLNDLSVIALAKTLRLPMVSMEKPVLDPTSSKRTIPNICQEEVVEHLTFNDFLRREGIRSV